MPTLALTLLFACSNSNLELKDTGVPRGDTDTDTATDTGEIPGTEPVWYSVDGVVRLRDGVPGEGSHLQVALWGRAMDGTVVQGCTDDIPFAEPTVATPPPDDVALYGAWSIPLTDATCAGQPAAVAFGIGPLIPELWPAAEAMSASLRQTRGLYLASGSQLTVFGLAATSEQAQGMGAPPSLDPLPDGRYELRGVWLLPL